jgi:predicted CopG family antitoxin
VPQPNHLAPDNKGRRGRPSVSEIVVELLERHRDEIDGLD